LNGLGIEGAGLATWEKILEHHPDLDSVLAMTKEELVAIDGFADKSAQQIVEGLRARKPLVTGLLKVGVQPSVQQRKAPSGKQPLAGQTFVITGTLSEPRETIESKIKDAGGKVSGSVSKTTTAVITNDTDSGSSKMQKAKQLGIPIWSEAKLFSAINI
jgi:DNA ligase (NAD+)